MTEGQDDRADVDWRAAMSKLRSGSAVDIPCATEEEFQRRVAQITKRGEKQGIPLNLTRGEGFLRIEPGAANEEARGAERATRRRERAERRRSGQAEDE